METVIVLTGASLPLSLLAKEQRSGRWHWMASFLGNLEVPIGFVDELTLAVSCHVQCMIATPRDW